MALRTARELKLNVNRCPICGDEVDQGDGVDIDGGYAYQRCWCVNGHCWIDEYKLVSQFTWDEE